MKITIIIEDTPELEPVEFIGTRIKTYEDYIKEI